MIEVEIKRKNTPVGTVLLRRVDIDENSQTPEVHFKNDKPPVCVAKGATRRDRIPDDIVADVVRHIQIGVLSGFYAGYRWCAKLKHLAPTLAFENPRGATAALAFNDRRWMHPN